jgi:hypothetical protein
MARLTKSELLINVVIHMELKTLRGSNPKGKWSADPLFDRITWIHRPPAKRQNLTHHVVQAEQGNPVSLLRTIRKAIRKGSPRRCGHRMSEKANAGNRKVKQYNWSDRGLNVTSRESGQTSDWSFNTRKHTEPFERRKANEDCARI